jgi:hypothetical protein
MPRRPQHWFPGLIGGLGVLRSSGPACTLNYAAVYPFGLMAQISVRFRGPLSLEIQRELSQRSGVPSAAVTSACLEISEPRSHVKVLRNVAVRTPSASMSWSRMLSDLFPGRSAKATSSREERSMSVTIAGSDMSG